MNKNFGLIGKKLGSTQVFNDDGSVTRVTAIQVGPCRVVGKRTQEKDGYSALILGFGERSDKNLTKAQKGLFSKIEQKPSKVLREFRLSAEEVAKFELGQELKLSEHLQVGAKVDVTGLTRGRGFNGVMRRWNFKGSKSDTHGTHEYRRHAGSIGTNMTPGRTLPNLKMAGQWGHERVTIQNLKIARYVEDDQIVLIEGSVPGMANSIVTVRGAVKAKRPVAA